MKGTAFMLLLALVAALSIPVTAFASPTPDATSNGSISFADYDASGDGILPPGEHGEFPLDLAEDEKEFDEKTQKKLRDLHPMGFDFGTHEASLFYKEYDSGDKSGLLVRSGYDGWAVTVKVNSFCRDDDKAQKTLKGAQLEFIPDMGSVAAFYSDIDFMQVEVNADDDSAAATIATGKAGIYGINYQGLLKVKGNTARKGKAQTVIDWAFQSAKP